MAFLGKRSERVATMAIRTVPCPLCQDGKELNPNSGTFVRCKVCKGTKVLTPDNICYCGLSCNTITDGFVFCGSADCLKNLKREKVLEKADKDFQPYSGSFRHW